MISIPLLLAIFILFGTAVSVIAYKVGFHHGHIDGHAYGLDEARGYWIPRVLKAKRDGAHCGRLIELRRQIDGRN